MVKNTLWIALLVAGCAQQQAPAPVALDVANPWEEYRAPSPLPTVMANGESCPPNYVVNPNNANDCVPAPGMVPVGIAGPAPVAQSIDAQTRVVRQIQQDQVNADLAHRRDTDNSD